MQPPVRFGFSVRGSVCGAWVLGFEVRVWGLGFRVSAQQPQAAHVLERQRGRYLVQSQLAKS